MNVATLRLMSHRVEEEIRATSKPFWVRSMVAVPRGCFHDLGQMDLDDWHPREIPTAVRFSAALRRQQAKALPPMEKWYISLLMTGRLPMAKKKKPHVTLSRHLVSHGKDFSPRLCQDLDEYSLKDFLTDESRIGVACDKVHTVDGNGWSFPPLSECREAIDGPYGPQDWTPITSWSEKMKEEIPGERLME
jgi:hypothetical protein